MSSKGTSERQRYAALGSSVEAMLPLIESSRNLRHILTLSGIAHSKIQRAKILINVTKSSLMPAKSSRQDPLLFYTHLFRLNSRNANSYGLSGEKVYSDVLRRRSFRNTSPKFEELLMSVM